MFLRAEGPTAGRAIAGFGAVLVLLIPLALPAASGGSDGARAAAAVPVLGSAFIGSVGYGHAHPRALSTGGADPLFHTFNITWKNWGAQQSIGTGTGFYLPRGKPVSGAFKATERLVAYDLGTCHGRLTYLKMDWWFPGRNKRHPSALDRNGKPASMCEP